MIARSLLKRTITTGLFIFALVFSVNQMAFAQFVCQPAAGGGTTTSSLTTGDPTQTGRIVRDGIPSSCAGKTNSLQNSTVVHAKSFNFTNPTGVQACVTVDFDHTACGGATNTTANVAYSTYNPALPASNVIGDSGFSSVGKGSYSFSVAAGASFTIVVHEINPNLGCASFSFTISYSTTCRQAGFDLTNDGKADPALFRPSSGDWNIINSIGGTLSQAHLGQFADLVATGDYDGGGQTDVAVFRPSTNQWLFNASSPIFGSAGDIPVPGDYDRDGKVDLATFRQSDNTWRVLRSSDSVTDSVPINPPGVTLPNNLIPFTGDFDGDRLNDYGVFCPSCPIDSNLSGSTAGTRFYVLESNFTRGFILVYEKDTGGMNRAATTDLIVPADYNGDGKTDIAFWTPATGVWSILPTGTTTVLTSTFGQSGDIPQPADYDGDKKADLAVYRPTTHEWRILRSSDNMTVIIFVGQIGDQPATAASYNSTLMAPTTNTPTGSSITVRANDAEVDFGSVSAGGVTTFTQITPSQGQFPGGYTLCPTCPAYDIATTATYSPPVEVCLAVPGSVTQPSFLLMHLMHFENPPRPGPEGSAGQYVDRTTGHRTEANGQRLVCGAVNSLSPFALAQAAAPTASTATISGRITDPGGAGVGGVTINLSGGTPRTTITDANGSYHLDDVGTGNFYSVTPSLANYHFSPANRSFSLVGNQTDAGFTASSDAVASANAIDSAEYFVRQQYLDFLGREPDRGGFDYWSAQFNQCSGDAACISQKRIDVSAAFFMSGEFQQTGSYVYDLFAGTLGRTPGYNEFTSDRAQVVGGSGLEAAKLAFAQSFIQRPEFTAKYPASFGREEFVDALLQTMHNRSGADVSGLRAGMLSDYDSGGRALVVRNAIEQATFVFIEYNKAFVLMEYFGYLRRGEEMNGYTFWLNVLSQGAGNNYRGMVCSFLTSTEYQRRFADIVTHGNGECAGLTVGGE